MLRRYGEGEGGEREEGNACGDPAGHADLRLAQNGCEGKMSGGAVWGEGILEVSPTEVVL
jgi:hypothetical protein